MSTFFISDLHFGHKNCMAYDDRPFPDIETHDAFIMDRWNSVVGLGDDVWILGDISWYSASKTMEIINGLNGTKHLCIGNHDKKLLKNRDVRQLFAEVVDYKELQLDGGTGLVLCHYPIPCFNHHFHGWIHLYGHVHVSFEWNMMKRVAYEMRELYGKPCRMFNVGCMIPGMDYTPRTLDEIIKTFEEDNDGVERVC